MSDLKMISNIDNLLINSQKTAINEIVELNKTTEKYGLTLTRKQVLDLINYRNNQELLKNGG